MNRWSEWLNYSLTRHQLAYRYLESKNRQAQNEYILWNEIAEIMAAFKLDFKTPTSAIDW